MKRVIFAAFFLVLVIIFNFYCLFSVIEISDKTIDRLDELYISVGEKNAEELVFDCEEFTKYWMDEHHVLSRIVKHDLLDQTTIAVSRFVPLAKFNETGELSSEINRCRILIEEIRDSEIPYLRNIL